MDTKQLFEFDKQFCGVVAGMDEAGRGPLAGPVVCACCVMGDIYIDGINDSKKVSEAKRERLYEEIITKSAAYGIGIIDNGTIDDINILQATKLGMAAAYENMRMRPDILLVDAVGGLNIDCKINPIIRGDATSYNIAAASIIAKVTRDRILREYALLYPDYGFDKHKGYGTALHIAALRNYGALPVHRKSFIKNIAGIID